MSIHQRDGAWVVRWREDAKHRSLTFATKKEAAEFDARLKAARQQARAEERRRKADEALGRAS